MFVVLCQFYTTNANVVLFYTGVINASLPRATLEISKSIYIGYMTTSRPFRVQCKAVGIQPLKREILINT